MDYRSGYDYKYLSGRHTEKTAQTSGGPEGTPQGGTRGVSPGARGARESAGSVDEGVLVMIQEALRGELRDRYYYAYLLSHAPDDSDAEAIAQIRQNELEHFDLFTKLYRELTGTNPPDQPQLPFEQPLTYCEGLRNAMFEEQNAIYDYNQILARLEDRSQVNTMFRIITDELRHQALFTNLYAKNNCRV